MTYQVNQKGFSHEVNQRIRALIPPEDPDWEAPGEVGKGQEEEEEEDKH